MAPYPYSDWTVSIFITMKKIKKKPIKGLALPSKREGGGKAYQ